MAFIVSLVYLKAIKKNGAAQQSRTSAIHWQIAAGCNILEYSNMQWNTVEGFNTLEYSRIMWNILEYSFSAAEFIWSLPVNGDLESVTT